MMTQVTPSAEEWDAFVKTQPRAHTLQRSPWGELKSAIGWDVLRVGLEEDHHLIAGAQLLLRPLPFGMGTMAYMPMGPYVETDIQLTNLIEIIDEQLRSEGVAFLKWEPGIFEGGRPDIQRWGFRESPQTIQPPRTIMIDISETEDEILARMSQSTRRKVRLSGRKGVHYYEAAREDISTFTGMLETTADRNDFGVHNASYYEMAYDLFVPDEHAVLILAEHEGTPLGGLMVFAEGNTAYYLYGASSNEKRNLMANYGLQWEAIRWAKSRGCTRYDMWGVPDQDPETLEAQFKDRHDGLWGVYGFKRGWGGEVVRSAGAWDRIYNPLIYTAYWTAAQLRD